jgi:hypothetical protein
MLALRCYSSQLAAVDFYSVPVNEQPSMPASAMEHLTYVVLH